MEYCDKEMVLDLFTIINKADINYILLRNLNNELPSRLPTNKDIDLLVNEKEELKFDNLLKNNGWKEKKHPLGHFPFLYGIKPFKFYYKNGIFLDICFQLACRSLNKGEWFPLDMQIQEDLWIDKLKTKNKPWSYTLSVEDEFVHLITRCIFDKKKFNTDYIERIEELLPYINLDKVYSKFQVIFFKYSEILLRDLKNKQYSNIITNYLQFKDY